MNFTVKEQRDQFDKWVDCIAQVSEAASSLWALHCEGYLDDPNLPTWDSDRCATCRKTVESKCYSIGDGSAPKLWHVECYPCSRFVSEKGLFDYGDDTMRFMGRPRLCWECHRVPVDDSQLQFVSTLRRYIYMLFVMRARAKVFVPRRLPDNSRIGPREAVLRRAAHYKRQNRQDTLHLHCCVESRDNVLCIARMDLTYHFQWTHHRT